MAEERGRSGVTFAGKLQKEVLAPGELAALCSLLHHEIPLRNGIRGWTGSRKSAHLAVRDYRRGKVGKNLLLWALLPLTLSLEFFLLLGSRGSFAFWRRVTVGLF